MKNTIQINVFVNDADVRDQLIAVLSDLQYDAFEEKEHELAAFIKEELFDAKALENTLANYSVNYTRSVIADQNWNALWESNFEPVVVDDFCAIRAEFHKPFTDIKHEIIITPKMSFGTGHHATTYLMISEMSRIHFDNKQAADFGTGTGVLAILAEKLGSKYVWAIDNDEWSINNAKENIERNGCANITIEKADSFKTKQKFDIILANINKHVILSNADSLFTSLSNKGQLLLSGLLKEDEDDVVDAFVNKGFQHLKTLQKNSWICILLALNTTD